MRELRPRTTVPEGTTIARRLRQLRHRTTRWFLPPVRGAGTTEDAARETPPTLPRGLKPPFSLH